jgi:hypothetical protein
MVGYQRKTTAPQAKPPPIASVTSKSPCLIYRQYRHDVIAPLGALGSDYWR